MANLKWRTPARYVAYISLVLLISMLLVLIVRVALSPDALIEKGLPVLIFTVIGSCGYFVLNIWLALNLLNSVKIETDPLQALRFLKVWLILNYIMLVARIILFVLDVFSSGLKSYGGPGFVIAVMCVGAVVAVFMILIVHSFFSELKDDFLYMQKRLSCTEKLEV